MKPIVYAHASHIDGLNFEFSKSSFVVLGERRKETFPHPMEMALFTIRLALRIGLKLPALAGARGLPYSSASDNLLFDAPLMSMVVGRRIKFLRGWGRYDSCVKGFNALGLLAEHVFKAVKKLEALSPEALIAEKQAFLRAKAYRDEKTGEYVLFFTEQQLKSFTTKDWADIANLDIALWQTYARRPIICSTSSNMGISLHQAMRDFQESRVSIKGKQVPVLNENEGWLVIWCPDEQADFMNSEKTETLRALETEEPPLTTLHTYINRQQRDPGALRDALINGGYFFPTNPQSKEEMQNLLFVSLNNIANERNTTVADILKDPKVIQALESLDCDLKNDNVAVTNGVEGGLYGLMIPYLLMLEETLQLNDARAVATWNQASIGAALAAIVLMDMYLRDIERLPKHIVAELQDLFPVLSKYLKQKKLGRHLKTRIHGVFDIANLQSLAQLLGVVVERHLSGRGTALVGLGSSSYANGNRCYEILKESMDNQGPFQGKETFHLSTHTLIPVAQALIWGEDLFRVMCTAEFEAMNEEERITFISKHVVKSEPAGAAAVGGYLLARLDTGTLSFFEIVYALRLAGFTRDNFLTFAAYGDGQKGADEFVQRAYEEGIYMGELAANILSVLDWPFKQLEDRVKKERAYSRLNYQVNLLDTDDFEVLNPVINIYLTGDNTRQPSRPFIKEIMDKALAHRTMAKYVIEADVKVQAKTLQFDMVPAVRIFFAGCSHGLTATQKHLDRVKKSSIHFMVKKLAVKRIEQ